MKYIVEFSNQNGIKEELIFNNEKEVLKWSNETFLEQFESYKELEKESNLLINKVQDIEFHISNGKKQLFKNGRKIIGYIKSSYKGYKFCTGKPSDPSCLSWDYEKYDEALKTAKEYKINYNSI